MSDRAAHFAQAASSKVCRGLGCAIIVGHIHIATPRAKLPDWLVTEDRRFAPDNKRKMPRPA